ncbi:MAG: orotidine-5'-phosphate decarboxylase [Clostridiales bacterium]|nr:orotidine-5'-phosphate decarboxylase [Candidatus Crickella equi]
MGKDVIIACDYPSADETLAFLDQFEKKPFVKIGMELFYAEGPSIVKKLKDRGHKVFLDLKLHDIPNTVKKSMKVLGAYGVDIVNVHAAGTVAMMQAAKEGLMEGAKDLGSEPLLIAVTQLTSTDEETMKKDLLIDRPLDEVVAHYAKNAAAAGLDGVVCSAHEAAKVHELCGSGFATITPGIRLAGDAVGDQKRVMTPAKAKEVGSDYIVVGRSITAAADPIAAYEQCCRDFI